MKKTALLLSMVLLLSTIQANFTAAEETNNDETANIQIETTETVAEAQAPMELTIEGAVKLATESSRELWKIDDGLEQLKKTRKDARDAKEAAEAIMEMSLDEMNYAEQAAKGAGQELDLTNNYVSTIMNKNGYYVLYADTQQEQLEKNRELILKGIEISTKSLYYNALVAEKTIEVNESKLIKANEQLKILNLKFNSRSVTRAEVLNGEIAAQKAKTDLDTAKDDCSIAKLNLLNKLNLDFDTQIILKDKDLTYVPTVQLNLDGAIEKAKAERPEIMTAENNLELQKIETHAYTAYYTSNLRQHKAAVEELKDAEYNYSQSFKNVELDVRTSYLNLVKAERALVNMDKTVELARESARINKLLYDNGMASSLEVLNADTGLAEAEIGRYQLLVSYNISKLMFDNSNLIASK
jgi:hypothetical protein